MIETNVKTYPFNAQVRGMAEKIRSRRRIALRPEGLIQERRSEFPSSKRLSESIRSTASESTPNSHDDDTEGLIQERRSEFPSSKRVSENIRSTASEATPISHDDDTRMDDSDDEENTDNQQHSKYDEASAIISSRVSDGEDNENISARISFAPSSFVEESEAKSEENSDNLSQDEDDIQDDTIIHEFDRTSKEVDPTYRVTNYKGREHLHSKESHDSERSSVAYDEHNMVDAGEDFDDKDDIQDDTIIHEFDRTSKKVDPTYRAINDDGREHLHAKESHDSERSSVAYDEHNLVDAGEDFDPLSRPIDYDSRCNGSRNTSHQSDEYEIDEINKTNHKMTYDHKTNSNSQEPSSSLNVREYKTHTHGLYDKIKGPTQLSPKNLQQNEKRNDQTDLLNNPNQRNDPVDLIDYSNSGDVDEVPYTVSEGDGTSVESEISSSDESSSSGEGNNLLTDEMADEVTQSQIKSSTEEENMMRSFDEKHKMNMEYASSKMNELKKKLLRTTSNEPNFMTERHIQNPQTKSVEIDKIEDKTQETKVDEVPTSISREQDQGSGIPSAAEDENNRTNELDITSVSSAESVESENNLLDNGNKESTDVSSAIMKNPFDDGIDMELTTLSGSSDCHSLTEVLSDTSPKVRNDSKIQGDNDQIQYSVAGSMPSSSLNKTNSPPNLDVGGQGWNYEADKQFQAYKGIAKFNQLYQEGMKFKEKKDAKKQLYEEKQQQQLQMGLNLATRSYKSSNTINPRKEPVHNKLYQIAIEKKKKESEREHARNIRPVSSSVSASSHKSKGGGDITDRLYKQAETNRFKIEQKIKDKEIKESSIKPKLELSTKDYVPLNKRSTNPEAIYYVLFEDAKKKMMPPPPPPLPPKGKTLKSDEAAKVTSRLHDASKKKEQEGKQRREEIKRAHTPRPPTPSGKISVEEANLIYERGMVFKAALELRREEQSIDPYCSPLITSMLSDEERMAEGRTGRTQSRGRVQTPLRYRSASRGGTPMKSRRSRSRSRCDTPLSRLSREHNFAPRKGSSGGNRSQTPRGNRNGVPKPGGYRSQTPIGRRE